MERRTVRRRTRSSATHVALAALAAALLAAACGSGEEIVAGAPAPTTETEPTVTGGPDDDTSDVDDGLPVSEDGPEMIDGEYELPNTPEPVDPKIVAPAEVVTSTENPNVIWVRFTGGDPNCTAVRVTVLRQTPDDIAVSLEVGITDDALVRSCLAGEFPSRVAVDLGEPVGERPISWEQPSEDGEAQLLTPDLSTDDIIGLTEAEVQALADENLFVWRVIRVDDEWFAVTEDFNPGRLNVEIEAGVVVAANLG